MCACRVMCTCALQQKFTLFNWGEPERAPHLMMSTAICMSSYSKPLPGNELLGTSGSTCTLIAAINTGTGPSARGNASYRHALPLGKAQQTIL